MEDLQRGQETNIGLSAWTVIVHTWLFQFFIGNVYIKNSMCKCSECTCNNTWGTEKLLMQKKSK